MWKLLCLVVAIVVIILVGNKAIAQEPIVLKGHQGNVRRLAFSQDGKMVATAGEDKTIRIWQAETGSELMTIKDNEWPVCGISFGLGDKLIIASRKVVTKGRYSDIDQGQLIAWDTLSGKKHYEQMLESPSYDVAMHPDGSMFVTCSNAGSIAQYWEAATGKEINVLRPSVLDPISAMCFSPNGRELAIGKIKKIEFCDAKSGKLLRSSKTISKDAIIGLSYSHDGNWIACGTWDEVIVLSTTQKEKQIRYKLEGNASFQRGAFMDDSNICVLSRGGVQCFGQNLPTLPNTKGYAFTLASSPGQLAIAIDDKCMVYKTK